ncbi:hypothetical protein EDC96DRAFT_498124 [Choanephora cucurbitarum]|nr:hypothetical protein EDC96DRAFT_498124 [Choanephora cucurbitarum]
MQVQLLVMSSIFFMIFFVLCQISLATSLSPSMVMCLAQSSNLFIALCSSLRLLFFFLFAF